MYIKQKLFLFLIKSLEKQHENVLFEKDEMQEELADLNETRTVRLLVNFLSPL